MSVNGKRTGAAVRRRHRESHSHPAGWTLDRRYLLKTPVGGRSFPGAGFTTITGLATTDRVRDGAAVAIPTVLAAVLCCYRITDRSLGFDEAASVTIAAQHGGALGSAIAHDGGNMSGYYLLLHAVIALFGNGLFAVRSLSVLATTGGVAALCVLGLRLFDRRVALAAGLLAAVSLPLVFWGQSARGYALMVASVTASFVAFAALVQRSAERRSAWGPWVAYVAFGVIGLYASFVAVLAIPAQLVVLWFEPRAARRVGAALIVIAACCVPLLVLAVSRGSGQLFWVPHPNGSGTLDVLYALASAGLRPSFPLTATSGPLLALTAVVVALVAVVIVGELTGPDRPRGAWAPAVVLAWALVPFLVALVESSVGQSIYLPRNLLMSLPAVALLLALGLVNRRVPALIGVGAVAALIALRALQLAPSYGVSPENWRAATAYVVAHAQPGDCLAFYPQDGRMGFRYYLDRGPRPAPALTPILPAAPLDEVRAFVEQYKTLSAQALSALPSRCPRVWLISSHQGQPNGPAGSKADLTRFRALQAALERAYPDHHRTVSFGYAAPVRLELLTGAG
jgi:mannosyltransferase